MPQLPELSLKYHGVCELLPLGGFQSKFSSQKVLRTLSRAHQVVCELLPLGGF